MPIAQQRLQEMARNVLNSRLFSARIITLVENIAVPKFATSCSRETL